MAEKARRLSDCGIDGTSKNDYLREVKLVLGRHIHRSFVHSYGRIEYIFIAWVGP